MNLIHSLLLTTGLIAAIPTSLADQKNGTPSKEKTGVYAKESEIEPLYKSMKKAIEKARRTYPRAKQSFLDGLPSGQNFFVVTRLKDKNGAEEQVFISVSEIKNGTVHGYIYNNIENVSGYEFRQRYSFPESEIYDWVITKENGRQSGNYVGRFLQSKYK